MGPSKPRSTASAPVFKYLRNKVSVSAATVAVAALGGGVPADAASASPAVSVITSCTAGQTQFVDGLITRYPAGAIQILTTLYAKSPDNAAALLNDLATCDPNGTVKLLQADNSGTQALQPLAAYVQHAYPSVAVLMTWDIKANKQA